MRNPKQPTQPVDCFALKRRIEERRQTRQKEAARNIELEKLKKRADNALKSLVRRLSQDEPVIREAVQVALAAARAVRESDKILQSLTDELERLETQYKQHCRKTS